MLTSVGHTLLHHYADFSGRADRKTYWTFVALSLGLNLILALAARILASDFLTFLRTVGGLLLLLPGLAISVRRLHDVGRSGYWLWLGVTGVGIVPLLWWFTRAGSGVGK